MVEKWRKDSDGNWESYDAYDYNREKAEMGHGAQSVFYLQKFIQLSEAEAQAIYWHMGAYDISPYSTLAHCSETFKWNPLAFLVHRADMAATYVAENEAFIFGEGAGPVEPVEEVEPEEEKPARSRRRPSKKKEAEDEAPVEEPEEAEEPEEKPARSRRRGAKKGAPKEEPKEEVDEEKEKPSRITRRKKATHKKEEPKEEAPEAEESEEPKSSIRMPRKGAAKKSAIREHG